MNRKTADIIITWSIRANGIGALVVIIGAAASDTWLVGAGATVFALGFAVGSFASRY